jgi:HD-GYP domain-containing protein (c-di-GMP phosphodiesterase class II)
MFSPDSSTSPFDPDRKMSRRLPVSPSAEKSDNEGAKEREGGEYGTHPYLERMESAERQAREICECGDYSRAIAELKAKGLLETQMARVRNTEEYREVLEGEPWLERPHIREMFTELELFDVPTWKHSLRVLKTIQEELGSKLRVGEYLRQGLAKEDVTEEDLKIAAGLHDFGKIAIPKFVLHDKTTEHDSHRTTT